MKRTIVLVAAVAVLASVAVSSVYAASLTVIPPINATGASFASCVSEDGRYVGGRTLDTDGLYSAGIYDTVTSSWILVPRTDTGVPALTGDMDGVAHRAGGVFYAAGNMNDNGNRTYSAANEFGTLYNGTANTTTRLAPSSNTMVGNPNRQTYPRTGGGAAASFADGTDAWITGDHTQGSNRKGTEGYIWKASNPAAAYATATGRSGSNLFLMAVSSTGRAVGWDTSGPGRLGVYINAGAGGTVAVNAVAAVPGQDTSKAWIAWGISDSGQYITGFQVTTSTTRPQGFLWKVGDPSATILPGLDGTINNNNQQGYCADVADDGTVVGWAYSSVATPLTTNTAIWFPGEGAKKLWDVAAALGIDMTGWTDNNQGATSIQKVGDQYYVTGYGTYNGLVRGYLMVLPEPATVVLLVIGGLAMLRRRR
jgi:hypothetical protein